MNTHKYILEPYVTMKNRYSCPRCGKPKVFVRYINTETGEYVSDDVGRCNRESKCGYHYTPKQYFADNPSFSVHGVNTLKYITGKDMRAKCSRSQSMNTTVNTPSIDPDTFKNSLTGYNRNNFIQYLIQRHGAETINEQIKRYFIGTSKHWPGATVFWQLDQAGHILAGKIMLYSEDGHRVKEPFSHITWVHKVVNIDGYCLKQGLFGEHLLKGNNLPVVITESEKAAVIGSIYLPDLLWLSCGQKNGLTFDKCKVLAGRTVILYPDLGAFDLWSRKAKELEAQLPGTRFLVSDLLEKNATPKEREDGLDIADYLTRSDLSELRTDKEPQYPPDWDNTEPDYTDYWALVNHLINKGLPQPKAEKAANNRAIQALVSAGWGIDTTESIPSMEELIEGGNQMAELYQSGKITANEYGLLSDALDTKIKELGIDPQEYVRTANNYGNERNN